MGVYVTARSRIMVKGRTARTVPASETMTPTPRTPRRPHRALDSRSLRPDRPSRGELARIRGAGARRNTVRLTVGLIVISIILGAGVTVAAKVASRPAVAALFVATKTVALDHMQRDAAHSWGRAEIGGGYVATDEAGTPAQSGPAQSGPVQSGPAHSGPAQFQIVTGAGRIQLPESLGVAGAAASSLTLNSARSENSFATVETQFGSMPRAQEAVSAGIELRRTAASAYRADVTTTAAGVGTLAIRRLDFQTNGETSLGKQTLPGIVSAATKLTIEFEVTGKKAVTLTSRVWVDTDRPNPATVNAVDSSESRIDHAGSVGLTIARSIARSDGISSSHAAAAPAKIMTAALFDNLSVFAVRLAAVQGAAANRSTNGAANDAAIGAAEGSAHGSTAGNSPIRSAGAAPIGTTRYLPPLIAVYVSPKGNNSAEGTIAAPVRTIARAVALARPGQTLVLRAGTYRESILLSAGSALSIQSYPGDAVWLDGSTKLTGWVRDGSAYKYANYGQQFDSSPTYTAGAPDGSSPGWRFVDPEHPMAAHPDQVWVGSTALRQVASRDAVTTGTFYSDTTSDSLFVGSNPQGQKVAASQLQKALTIRTADSKVRGIGVTRFAPSVPQLGAITAEMADTTLQNLIVSDSATTGIFVTGAGTELDHVSVLRSGMLGISVSQGDQFAGRSLMVTGNNTEDFNSAPVSGGLKITKSRGVLIDDSTFANNLGQGLWFDESTYDGTVTTNTITGNASNGLIVELSAQFVIANNIIANNGANGLKINDSSNVSIWNNSLTSNNREINIVQDFRRASNLQTAGHDTRRPMPDPEMTWVTAAISIKNNVLARTNGNCLLCVEDYSKQFTGQQMGVTANSNVYERNHKATPQWLIVWSEGAAEDPAIYPTLPGFVTATGLERSALFLDDQSSLNRDHTVTLQVASLALAKASPLPASIAAVTGKSPGSRVLGAWR